MHLINSFSFAGAEKLTLDITKNMDKEIFEIFVCSIGESKDKNELEIRNLFKSHGIQTLSLQKRMGNERLKTMIRLRNLLLEHNIDILHTHCPSPDLYGKIAGLLSNIKVVVSTIHNTEGYSPLIENVLKRITTHYIAISGNVKNYATKKLKLPSLKISVIYNGIDMANLRELIVDRPSKLAQLDIKSPKIVLTCVGRIVQQKGYEFLIRAFNQVLKKVPNVHLIIVGSDQLDPVYAQKIKQMVVEDGLDKNITFAGVRNDVKEILLASDIFVSSSIYEGFALVTIEALATGLPIVATDVGSIRELVEEGVNGYIVEAANDGQLAERIIQVINNMDVMKQTVISMKEAVIRKFSITNTVALYEKLYLDHYYAKKLDMKSEVTLSK
ncbi:hypothetical protein SD70_15780 [Gordoniibacillus kamchatkensis]|uniref:Glycosyltransferase n=2 Tax=Gordoniibacillus kamchatkensis TaxID=1590651 RepID=A0ABR5AGV5_9BACL|nr:hypothetical protein SD70_15780 [Paenibacillus sp. VKM B-2647]